MRSGTSTPASSQWSCCSGEGGVKGKGRATVAVSLQGSCSWRKGRNGGKAGRRRRCIALMRKGRGDGQENLPGDADSCRHRMAGYIQNRNKEGKKSSRVLSRESDSIARRHRVAGYTENLNKEGKVTAAPPLEKVVEEFTHIGE